MKDRIDAWIRWLLVPWLQPAIALALIGAAAAPALLIASADLWQEAAGDEFAQRVVGALTTAEAGVTVVTNAVFEAESDAHADELLEQRISEVDGLGAPIRTMWTPRGSGQAGPEAVTIGIPLRVMARSGAVEALTVVESDPTIVGGVWVSQYLAERTGVGLGDLISYESPLQPEVPGAEVSPSGGPRAVWPVAGIYQPLWSREGGVPSDYWAEVPADLMPTFLTVFNAPNFSLLILGEDTMADSRLTGFVQWNASSADVLSNLEQTRARASAYRALDRSLTQDPQIAAALSALAAIRPAAPTTETRLLDALDEIDLGLAQLDRPLETARTAGVLVGLAVVVAGAAFVVQRRRTEYRLLAGEGDRWPIFSGRAAAQLAGPIAIGTTVGAVVGVLAATWVGPAESPSLGVVDVSEVALVAAVGLVLAALVTGGLAQRTLDRGVIGVRGNGAAFLVVLLTVGAAVLLWYQVPRSAAGGEGGVDLAVTVLPLTALMAAVGLVSVVLHLLSARGRFFGGSLPTPLFLAWRRVTHNDLGSRLVVGALAVGLGLVVMSAMLVGSLERNTDVKLSTEVGSETMAEFVPLRLSDVVLPPDSTLLAFDPARLYPGNQSIRVVAVDSATFASTVSWPAEFGSDAATVVSLLEADTPDAVPVVAVDNVPIPSRGTFGSQRIPYTVVGTVSSAPLAYEFGATLLASAERIDRIALERLGTQLETNIDDPVVASHYQRPTDGYRKVLVSRQPRDVVTQFLAANDLRTRSIVSRAELAGSIDVVAPRIAFDYLKMLGYVAAATALAALLLHLAARRARRSVAALMTRRMGLSPGRSAFVTVLEVVALTVTGLLTAFAVAPLVTMRLLPHFDRNPDLPPAAVVTTDPLVLTAWFLGAIVAIAAAVWLMETGASRRDQGRALRGE